MATEGLVEYQTSSNASNGNSKNVFAIKKTMQKNRKSSSGSGALAFHIRTALVGSYRTKKTTANKQVEFSSERTTDLTTPPSSPSSCLSKHHHHHQDTSSSSSSSDDVDDQRTPSETEEVVVPGDNKIVDMEGIRQAASKDEDEDEIFVFEDQEEETSNMVKVTTKTNKKKQQEEIITLDAFALVLSLPGNHKINRIGLDKLYRVVKRSKVNLRDREASRAIVIGGESTRSSEEQLREALLYYLCKEGEEESKLEEEGGGGRFENINEDDDDDASTDSLYVEDEDDQDQDEENNKYDVSKTSSWLELHLLALKILARALDSLTATRRDTTAASDTIVVDGRSGGKSDDVKIVVNIQEDAFWPKVVDMLLYNVSERQLPTTTPVQDDDTTASNNVRIIGYSLKIFRLLHSIDSMGGMMQQMLHQSLLPYVTHLKQICKEEQEGGGNKSQFSMIAYETSKLLKKANY